MDHQHKVLWSEGLFLTPQHLQQADRYHEHALLEGLRALNGFIYGLTELRIDEDALNGGDFILQSAAGLMPDGLVFDLPEHDARPASRPLAASFAANMEKMGVYLVCPLSYTHTLCGSAARSPQKFTDRGA